MARLIGTEGRLIGLDRDPTMVGIGENRLREALSSGGPAMSFAARPYEALEEVLRSLCIDGGVNAILLDLGVNSLQLDEAERGFGFSKDGPLDGRFNPREGNRSMADLVNNASERDLARWLSLYGDERLARPIAKRIASERARGPITTTRQLADLVYTAYPPDQRRGRIHPATRTFQALRIASNDELGAVERGLRVCAGCLVPGGRMAVISFHSGEDRIVKQFFRELTAPREDPSNPYSATTSEGIDYTLITAKALECTEEEAARNPRARSAKLRAIERKGVAG
jgi:16S rRNA (cytosine1402-N4)-methyltransferase